ncbi:diguanylate cyclase [Trichlorobacter lovleyi]|uniref:diguanylate cyclase n=1 Tax=Trichlorobacter lovleyi TaxID=313985 RepID=UPI002240DC23|nr:diguanylate cyclase [Trichlorobacter lovleyi]QOX78120.1 diguanylate cyclase [Trichlorobacter lovleyi]
MDLQPPPITALVLDDNRNTRRRIVSDLEQSGLFHRITEAVDGLDGFKQVSENAPDLILCDLEMPRIDGLRFLQMIRSKEETKDIPVLILTGRTERSLRLKGLSEGANDFLLIPYDPEELIARVKLHLKSKELEKNLKKRNMELELLTHKDPLTGAFNRRYLSMSLDSEIMRHARTGEALSLLMLDIDHFKDINDTYGHHAGDLVLQRVTKRLTEGLREYDLLARYGGEEFVVVLPSTSPTEAEMVAQRLLQGIHRLTFSDTLAGTAVTVSIGVISHSANSVISAAELLSRADTALYRAKQSGRNRVVTYDNGLSTVSATA